MVRDLYPEPKFEVIQGIPTYVKRDDVGFIIDPVNLDYKCGWGKTKEQAIQHFFKRNDFNA